MATKIIKVEFDLPLPNEYLVDHEFNLGKSRKYTYHGPDKIYLQVGEDGYEKYGPLTEDDIADGRPMPADVVEWHEVDCTVHPLICQLRGPIVNESQEISGPIGPDGKTPNPQTGDSAGAVVAHPQSPNIAGFEQYHYSLPILPKFVWDPLSVRVVDGEPVARPFKVTECLFGQDLDIDVTDIRMKRNEMLSASDNAISSDMPTAMVDAWKDYRQNLRDWPTLVETHGIPAIIAAKMPPLHPDTNTPYVGVGAIAASLAADPKVAAVEAKRLANQERIEAEGLAQMERAKYKG